MKNVVVAFRRRTRPNVRHHVAKSFDIVEVAEQNLVINVRAKVPRLKKVHRVEISNVDATLIGRKAASVLLHVQTKKAHLDAVDNFERKHGLATIRKFFGKTLLSISKNKNE